MLVSIIDLCHFISLLVALTLAEGHRVNGKQHLMASFYQTVFSSPG